MNLEKVLDNKEEVVKNMRYVSKHELLNNNFIL